VLLLGLAWQADFERLLIELSGIEPGMIALAFAAIVATNCVRAANWYQLLRALNVVRRPAYLRTLYCHFCGGFFGQMIPSTAGMDAVRACLAHYSFGSHVAVTGASVFVLNAVSWMAASAFGLLGLRFLQVQHELPQPLGAAGFLFLGAITCAALGYWVLRGRSEALLRRIGRLDQRRPALARALRKFVESVLLFERARVRILPVFFVAALVHLAQAGVLVLVAASVGAPVGLAEALVLLPLGALANLAPISIAGFGLPQLAVGTALSLFGVPAAQALLVASVWAALVLLVNAAAGGVAYLWGRPLEVPLPRKV
jgi:uncharacterized membrane protein YbhN (UPF0104 family)